MREKSEAQSVQRPGNPLLPAELQRFVRGEISSSEIRKPEALPLSRPTTEEKVNSIVFRTMAINVSNALVNGALATYVYARTESLSLSGAIVGVSIAGVVTTEAISRLRLRRLLED